MLPNLQTIRDPSNKSQANKHGHKHDAPLGYQ